MPSVLTYGLIASLCAVALQMGASAPNTVRPEPLQVSSDEHLFEIYDDGAFGEDVRVTIALDRQEVFVTSGGTRVAWSRMTSGGPATPTPTGEFEVLERRVSHVSWEADGVEMPFMQRLTYRGVALHAGQLLKSPGSAGCIRLPPGFAEWLFERGNIGLSVTIVASLDEV